MVVAGGTTPGSVYERLAHKELAWHRVQVLLSDERWVSAEHEDSNERMLRETLITSRATFARLLPIFEQGTSIEDRCLVIDETIRGLPLPFACALLGMGDDGHFASLFPGANNLRQGLDPDSTSLCIPVMTSASAYARVSLTLSAIARSEEILLLAYGEAKRAVIERATREVSDLPVSHLFAQRRAPVHIFWAP